MKNTDDLIQEAAELAELGHTKGEIADELNVSRATATWLVQQSGVGTPAGEDDEPRPKRPTDIHVDWSAFGRDSARLHHLGAAMADLLLKQGEEVDLTVGIEKAGVPIATVVSRELETDLSTYAPRKHQWEEGDIEDLGSSFSRNFARIRDRDCYVVDDTITSGTTMSETVEAIRSAGGNPVACVVLADKQGLDEIEGVPLYSLLQVIPVGESE